MIFPGQLRVTYFVARNEFARVFFHPLTPVIVLMLSFLAILNGVGGTQNLVGGHSERGLYYCIGQTFMFTSAYGVVVAVFIGVMSVAEERRNHSLNIILSKPLYRRDLIAGKLAGLNCYMLMVIMFSILLAGLALSLFYFTPTDPLDFLSKVAIYVLIAFVYLSLNIAIALLISAVFKDLLISATVAITYIYVDGYVGWTWISPVLNNFSPRVAMCNLYNNQAADLQSTVLTVGQWFDANAANLFFLIAAVLLVSLIAMSMFARSENV
jgi:ABC-2 type transport system permease protein